MTPKQNPGPKETQLLIWQLMVENGRVDAQCGSLPGLLTQLR